MVDTRTLTVGSHVMVSGVMATIESVGDAEYIGYTTADDSVINITDPSNPYVEPIAITEELLKGMGFEWSDISASMWRHYEKGRVSLSDRGNGWWKVYVLRMDWQLPSEFYCRRLHEAEAFVRMACGVELFKD